MIIDPRYRKCVIYLYIDVKNKVTGQLERKPAASGFCVCIEVPETGGILYLYIVTARHVIEKSREYGKLYIRFNTKDGEYVDVTSSQDDWVVHPSTDVAMIPTTYQKNYDVTFLSSSFFVTPEFIVEQGVIEGDDVFFSGLFQSFPGQQRTHPIVRFGNISLMPHEKIPIKIYPDTDTIIWVDAFLVESRSWGGHSGSPAFLYFTRPRDNKGVFLGEPPIRLLGLVSSHWEIPQDVDFIGDILGSGTVNINAGIAIVIPAEYILELMNGDELMEKRKQMPQVIQRV